MTVDQTADWTPPGPGTWELDTAHFETTVSRLARDMMEEVCSVGLAQGMELAGGPLKTMDAKFVNGRMYRRLVPLVGADKNLPPPPKPVLWAVTRLHPAFRKRAKRSQQAIDEKFWLIEFDRWEREWKPELIAVNRSFGDVDVTGLTDAQLATHLAAMWRHIRWAGALHFRLHTSDLAPIGRLLVRAIELGLDQREVMATLAGASPATSAPSRSLARIKSELDAIGCEPMSLDDVRDSSDRAAELLDEYLAEFGNRLTTGYDFRNRTLVELPDVVLSSIRSAGVQEDTAAHVRGEAAFEHLIAQVDVEHRAELTTLIEEARTLYGLRDENGPLTFEWPGGVMRLAVLEAGRRLVSAGRLNEHEHVFDATAGELTQMLSGPFGPSSSEFHERCAERLGWAELVAPDVLGPVMEPPDVDLLPGAMADMMKTILVVTDLIEREADAGDITAGAALTGTGVGVATHRGTARVVANADEAFERAEPGDIIVTRLTVPTFNSVLAMAGGVVTEGGGLLSHTAVIARELGIPAVIGVVGALTEIPDGATIELDPVNGTVTVL